MLLKIQNLSICFYKNDQLRTAVDDLSFSLRSGEFFALIGESGSGKTVTALSVLGLLDAMPGVVEGRVVFAENNLLDGLEDACLVNRRAGRICRVQKDMRWQRQHQQHLAEIRGRRIAMIFQEPLGSLDPFYTVGEQLEETVLRWKKAADKQTARQKAAQWLERVAIGNAGQVMDYYPHQLSGGMAQRVMIALALCGEPQLLIADEPTTALDAPVRQEIMQLLRELQQSLNLTILFISHDLALVRDFADSVAILYQGKLVENGRCAEVLQQSSAHAHPFTRSLLASLNGQPREKRMVTKDKNKE